MDLYHAVPGRHDSSFEFLPLSFVEEFSLLFSSPLTGVVDPGLSLFSDVFGGLSTPNLTTLAQLRLEELIGFTGLSGL